MELTLGALKNTKDWEKLGIALPQFDIEAVKENTLKAPEWVHFGAGNIFRGFIGSLAQRLLNSGDMTTGITAVETFDFDIIDEIYEKHDNLTLNVLMDKSSELEMEVLGGVVNAVKASDFEALAKIAENPSLKLISYTITEKGYNIYGSDGDLSGIVKEDIANGPVSPKHAMSITAAMLYRRFKNCSAPIAVVSMDNCSHNGEKLAASVMEIVKAWVREGKAENEFLNYMALKVTFPWSMIDKITPRPSEKVQKQLESMGFADEKPIVTSKNTYIAPFVNAEVPQYLVVEDRFPNGRPPLENAGVYMTDRTTVNKSETMKVTTCLNPLHTGLAVFGCLLGYKTIWEEMQDEDLKKLVNKIADEGMKVVINPGIINPQSFVREVIEDRLPNSNIPDMPQRIATDTSQKVGIRYGETIKAYVKSDKLNVKELTAIPMAIAGWIRYLIGIDDAGKPFERSSDPMLGELDKKLKGLELGKIENVHKALSGILSNKTLFGSDLYAVGLGDTIEEYVSQMIAGVGSVRETLQRLQ